MAATDHRHSPNAYAILTSSSPSLTIKALVDRDAGVITGGYGGWQIQARPRRQGLTVWQGREPFTLELNLIFDNFFAGISIEQQLSSLERMALPPADYRDPPTIKLKGPTIPHNDLTWVLNGIAWGSAERNTDGERIRQLVKLTMLRYVAADTVELLSASARARTKAAQVGSGTKTIRTYQVKQGDTIQSIAAKVLGDAKRWKEIADLNKLRDPTSLPDMLRVPLK